MNSAILACVLLAPLAANPDSSIHGSESITIPKGFRVVSVPLTVHSAAMGLVQPGDRVDLLVLVRKGPEVAGGLPPCETRIAGWRRGRANWVLGTWVVAT